jgi:hypothetical protein
MTQANYTINQQRNRSLEFDSIHSKRKQTSFQSTTEQFFQQKHKLSVSDSNSNRIPFETKSKLIINHPHQQSTFEIKINCACSSRSSITTIINHHLCFVCLCLCSRNIVPFSNSNQNSFVILIFFLSFSFSFCFVLCLTLASCRVRCARRCCEWDPEPASQSSCCKKQN